MSNDKSVEYFGERTRTALEVWQETLERAIGPMAWGLTPEDLTPHGIGRMRARAATSEDKLLAVLVAGLHVRARHAQG